MSSAIVKAANTNNPQSSLVKAALFHSTPFLQRKRRNFWDSRCNNHHSRRFRRMKGKQRIMRSVNDYADFLFQSWKEGIDEDHPSSSRGTSWFRNQYSSEGFGRFNKGNQGSSQQYRRDPFFCEDDFDVETIFRSAFGGNRFFYWSFINEENPQWRRSGRFSNEKSWSWSYRSKNHFDSSSESDTSDSDSDLAPDRLALGLSASGPLKLEDVKNAYRACALKWHPDRHQGSSKAVAEEKFKLCSAAYQSLCNKLALD
ncbi:hypothetical protein RJT34_20251 [Clitoria ternatea]|uniref:J domain-containing protein n=1 Tax=Clitoria ternatea TaxID=43366 RepID=A0AAN9IT24_CLITE